MRSKSQTAWETAARCATLAQEANDPEERLNALHTPSFFRKHITIV